MNILKLLDTLIHLFLFPFHSFHPFLALGALCLCLNLAGMFLYKRVTNQETLGRVHDRIQLTMLEMRARPNTIWEFFTLLKQSFYWNGQYLRYAFLPSLIILAIILPILFPIQSYFAYYPIRTDTVFSIAVSLKEDRADLSEKIRLENAPSDWTLIDSESRANNAVWFFRAKKNGEHFIRFTLGDSLVTKRVIVSDRIVPVHPVLQGTGWEDELYSLEKTELEANGQFRSVSVNYEEVVFPFQIFGFTLDWLAYFLLIFLVLILITKPLAKIY